MCPTPPTPSTPRDEPARPGESPPGSRTVSRPRPRTDGGRSSGSLAGDEAADAGALLDRLAAADVVTTGERGELFLAADVRRTWEAGMRRLRGVSDAELAAATASAAPFAAEGRVDGGGDWVVVSRTDGDGTTDADGTGGTDGADRTDGADEADGTDGADEGVPGGARDDVWLSRAHAVADTAAVAALRGRVDAPTAARAAAPLRLFLETCPICGGAVQETGGTGGGGNANAGTDTGRPVLACADCGEPLCER